MASDVRRNEHDAIGVGCVYVGMGGDSPMTDSQRKPTAVWFQDSLSTLLKRGRDEAKH